MNEFGFNQMAWLFGGQEVDLSSAERAIDQLSQDRDAAQVDGMRPCISEDYCLPSLPFSPVRAWAF